MDPRPESHTTTKRDLVERIAEATGQTKILVREGVQGLFDEMVAELVRGNRLEFRNFGVFEVRMRPGRIAQNPKTLEKLEVPEKRVVRFRVGQQLKRQVEAGRLLPSPRQKRSEDPGEA